MNTVDVIQYPTPVTTNAGDTATLASLNALMSNTNRDVARNLTLA